MVRDFPHGDSSLADLSNAGYGEHCRFFQRVLEWQRHILRATDFLIDILRNRRHSLSCLGMAKRTPVERGGKTRPIAPRTITARGNAVFNHHEPGSATRLYLFSVLDENKSPNYHKPLRNSNSLILVGDPIL